MKLRVFALQLLFTFTYSSQCMAQNPWTAVKGLEEHYAHDQVLDTYMIHDVAFVTKASTVFEANFKERDISKVISRAAAAKAGLPTEPMSEFIDQLLGYHHGLRLKTATATNYGDRGFAWTLKWRLYLIPGGSGGAPYEYHAIVRADGTRVTPELYLCYEYGSYTLAPERTVFSVFAFDDLLPVRKDVVDDGKIKRAAENRFNSARTEYQIKRMFQTLSPQRMVYSGRFTSNGTKDEELEVWAVRFVDKAIECPRNVAYAGSIVVWVTSDLMTSEITQGTWKAVSRRKDARAN